MKASKVVYRLNGRLRSMRMEIAKDTYRMVGNREVRVVAGSRLNKEGDPVGLKHLKGGGFEETVEIVFGVEAVVPLYFDPVYGELVLKQDLHPLHADIAIRDREG